MPKIIINYKICDKAAECGGIARCPNHAISYDEKLKRPVWDASKCTFCLQCTMPDSCPIGAIMYARDEEEEKTILNTIAQDPHSEDWLWQERYGTFPGYIPPLAVTVTDNNLDQFIASPGIKLLDVWHPDFVDCRLHSPLFSSLVGSHSIPIFKLNAQDYPSLAVKLNISQFPSLIIMKDNQVASVYTGYIKDDKISDIIQEIEKLL